MEAQEIQALDPASTITKDTLLVVQNADQTVGKLTLEQLWSMVGIGVVNAALKKGAIGSSAKAEVENARSAAGINTVNLTFTIPELLQLQSMSQTKSSAESEGINEYTFTMTDGTKQKLTVYNGAQGATGESGVTSPATNYFTLSVDDDGYLCATVNDGSTVPLEYDESDGCLYYVVNE